MRMTWRTACGWLSGLVAAVVWAVASARYMPIVQPTGSWLGDDGVTYPQLASNNTYWPRDVRHLAVLLALAGVLLIAGLGRRALVTGSVAAGGWLAADLLVDRLDLSGTVTVVLLAAAATVYFGATSLTAKRLSGGQDGGPLVRHVAAGTAAMLALASLLPVTPWIEHLSDAQLRIEIELMALKLGFATLFAVAAAGLLPRPVRNVRLTLGVTAVAVAAALAWICLTGSAMGPDFTQIMPVAFVAVVVAAAAPRINGTAPLLGLIFLGVFGAFASLAVLYLAGMLLGGALTGLAGNPPVNGADSDLATPLAAVVIGIGMSLASYLVTSAPTTAEAMGSETAGPAEPAGPATPAEPAAGA
ncbi:hypothetical protein CS0771_40950 [Catellatospora sp. IY07-71]|nr:hypothetical protein CS0771_40950 [Catellatospora sp. IY07-71]